MDTRQMRCILAISEAGSLTRAAERLGLAQPALTPVSYTHQTLPTKRIV